MKIQDCGCLVGLVLFAAFSLEAAVAAQSPASERPRPNEVSPGQKPTAQSAKSGSSAPQPKPVAEDSTVPSGATVIVALKRTKFDPKQNKVVFVGEVQLEDPRFALRSDSLTAYLKKGDGSSKKEGAPAAGGGAPVDGGEQASKGPLEIQQSGGGLESAEAEGNVEIVQERVNPEGKPERNVIRARKAVYVSASETMTLTGWPQVLQAHNGNMLKALREDTVMVLNKSGDVDVHGPAKSVFVNPAKNGK